jgi:hypothetical protein
VVGLGWGELCREDDPEKENHASGRIKRETHASAGHRQQSFKGMIETNSGESVQMTLLCNFMQRPFESAGRHKRKKNRKRNKEKEVVG